MKSSDKFVIPDFLRVLSTQIPRKSEENGILNITKKTGQLQSVPHLDSLQVIFSQTTGSLTVLDILTSGFFFKHILVFVYHSFFCQSLTVMAIILSLLCCCHLLCPRYYIARYWNQSAFSFKALSCHPSAIICFHPLKLLYNGNHAMRTKAQAERKKEES